MQFRRLMIALGAAAALGLGAGGAALAQDAPCVEIAESDRQADEAAFVAVVQEFNQGGGYAAIQRRATVLEAALARTPATPELLAACPQPPGGWAQSPYPMIAFLLGALNVEHGRFEEAERVMRRGLLMAPNDPLLVAENSQALIRLKRFDEVLTATDSALAANPGLDARMKARLLRSRGFALGELNRFDEAEASYTDSLRFEPGNRIAKDELRYLKRRRRGAPAAPAETVNSTTGELSEGDRR